MPLNLFYTMVQKSLKWPKTQIKGGPALIHQEKCTSTGPCLPKCVEAILAKELPYCPLLEAQWPIGHGVGLRIKWSSVRIRPWPLRWVLGQGSLHPLSQGEAFTLASISYLAILVKYTLAKKKPLAEQSKYMIGLLSSRDFN